MSTYRCCRGMAAAARVLRLSWIRRGFALDEESSRCRQAMAGSSNPVGSVDRSGWPVRYEERTGRSLSGGLAAIGLQRGYGGIVSLDQRKHGVDAEGLVERPFRTGLDRALDEGLLEAGHHDDARLRPDRPNGEETVDAIHDGHADVHEDDVEIL